MSMSYGHHTVANLCYAYCTHIRGVNLEDVRRALRWGGTINESGYYGNTALMFAVYYSQQDAVELLMSQAGLDVNIAHEKFGSTALHKACESNHFQALGMLLTHPAVNSHNVKNCAGQTPLMVAIAENSIACIKELLEIDGVDLDTHS